jgi:hypothetical protein
MRGRDKCRRWLLCHVKDKDAREIEKYADMARMRG